MNPKHSLFPEAYLGISDGGGKKFLPLGRFGSNTVIRFSKNAKFVKKKVENFVKIVNFDKISNVFAQEWLFFQQKIANF